MALYNATNRDLSVIPPAHSDTAPVTAVSKHAPSGGNVTTASNSASSTSLKRPLHSDSDSEDAPDPYTALPPPTNLKIQLRLQLARFKNVYRIVRVPTNYTFALLHALVQYVFGWNDSHLHQMGVYTHVQMYSGNYRKGEIKKCGRRAPLPPDADEYDIFDWEHCARYLPVYRVVKRRRIKEDGELTLAELWDVDEEKNISKGECNNAEIGIKYEYDLGSSWDVHITVDPDHTLFDYDPPSNTPDIHRAKGAPPIEDASEEEIFDEIEAAFKTVPKELYKPETFLRYLKGEVRTETSEEALKIIE